MQDGQNNPNHNFNLLQIYHSTRWWGYSFSWRILVDGIEPRVAEEEFWLIWILDFVSLVEWQEGFVGRDVEARKDLAKGKIVLEFALKKK